MRNLGLWTQGKKEETVWGQEWGRSTRVQGLGRPSTGQWPWPSVGACCPSLGSVDHVLPTPMRAWVVRGVPWRGENVLPRLPPPRQLPPTPAIFRSHTAPVRSHFCIVASWLWLSGSAGCQGVRLADAVGGGVTSGPIIPLPTLLLSHLWEQLKPRSN